MKALVKKENELIPSNLIWGKMEWVHGNAYRVDESEFPVFLSESDIQDFQTTTFQSEKWDIIEVSITPTLTR